MTETLKSEDKEYRLSVKTHYESSKHLKGNLYKKFMNNQETEMEIKSGRPSSLLCSLSLSDFGACPKGMDVCPPFIFLKYSSTLKGMYQAE